MIDSLDMFYLSADYFAKVEHCPTHLASVKRTGYAIGDGWMRCGAKGCKVTRLVGAKR